MGHQRRVPRLRQCGHRRDLLDVGAQHHVRAGLDRRDVSRGRRQGSGRQVPQDLAEVEGAEAAVAPARRAIVLVVFRAHGHRRDEADPESLRRSHRSRWRRSDHRGGRVPRLARSERLRQDHALEDDRRAGETDQRRRGDRRHRRQRPSAPRAEDRHGVPELRSLSTHDGGEEHRFSAQGRGHPQGTDRREGAEGGFHVRHRAPPAPQAAAALGRRAAAGGAGEGDGARALGIPPRRAALEPRRQAAHQRPRRGAALPAPPGNHHHLRHPRPGGGDGVGPSHRGDEQGEGAPARAAAGGLQRSGGHLRGWLPRLAADEFLRAQRRPRRVPARTDAPPGRVLDAGAPGARLVPRRPRRKPRRRPAAVRVLARPRARREDDHQSSLHGPPAHHRRAGVRVLGQGTGFQVLRQGKRTADRAEAAVRVADDPKALARILIAPALIYIGAVIGVPFVLSLWFAVSDVTVSSAAGNYVGLENFRSAMGDPSFRRALRNTFLFAVASQVIVVILATTLAVALQQDIHDAANIDGAGFFRTMFQITIPLVLPILLVAVLFGFVFAFTDMIVVWVLTRGGPYDMTQVLASLAFFKGIDGGDLAGASAIALFLFPVLAAAAILLLRLARRAEVI